MNRRAFLLGAAALPVVAPAIAAAAPAQALPLARGGIVGRGALYLVGERGIEYLVPAGAWKVKGPEEIAADVRRACRGLQDSGTFTITMKPTVAREPAI